MTIQIIWTALPNGLDSTYYYFSVFVSHRLSGGLTGALTDYPLGLANDPTNWASQALELFSIPGAMTVSVNGGANYVSAELLQAGAGVPQFWAPITPALWTSIFPPTLPVEDHTAEILPQSPSKRTIRTYNATEIVNQHEDLYRQVALSSGDDHPSVSTGPVADFVTALGAFPDLLAVLRDPASSANLLGTVNKQFPNAPAAARIAFEHYLAYRFYRRNTGSQYGKPNPAAVTPPPIPTLTFHKLVGMLADHPTLLRSLGLVLDFRIFKDQVAGLISPPAPGAALVVKVVPTRPIGTLVLPPFPVASCDNRYPQTSYRVTSDGFFALDWTAGLFDNGLLSLASSQFSVAQLDADGAAQKMIAYGASAAGWTYNAPGSNVPDAKREARLVAPTQSLPARRTGGLTVLHSGRAAALAGQFGQSDTNNANLAFSSPLLLSATDVCRGFRVDVWDADSETKPSGGPWRSLCQRSGIDKVNDSPFPLAPADVEGFVKAASGSRGDLSSDMEEQNTLYLHEAVFGWDGWSLCARRPGRSISHDDGDGEQKMVIRFQGNHAPAGYPIASNYAVTPGTLPRLRFGHTYYFRARTVDLAGNSLPLGYQSTTLDATTASNAAKYLRYEPVAAPTLVLWRSPTEGESLETLVIRSNPTPVDDLAAITPGANASAYAATSVAQAAGYLDHCDRHVAPPKTSQIMAETHGMLDGLSAQAAFNVSNRESGTLFDSQLWNLVTGALEDLPHGELAFVPSPGPTPGDPPASGQYVLHQQTLTLTYLPDPLAGGLAIRPGPGSASPPIVLPYAVNSAGWPRVAPIVLTVAESTMPTITFSTAPSAFSIGLPPATLAVLRYSTSPSPELFPTTVVGDQVAGTPDALASAVVGGHWMLSPYRELTLVHAVQRPLLIPSFKDAGLGTRDVGATYVVFTRATQVNVDGRSTAHIDINASWSDPIDDPTDPGGPAVSEHTGRAFALHVDYADTSVFANPPPKDMSGAAAPALLNRHQLGDTKHRWVSYEPDATTRYPEYFPAALTADPTQIMTLGKPEILNVLASRAPDPMQVLYAIPSFKWTTNTDGSVTRSGRTVRVYFDRPWYSSGDDELVGVVLAPASDGPVDPALAKYTSEWGRDPAWSSTAFGEPIGPQHFSNALTDAPQPAAVTTQAQPLSVGPFPLVEDATLFANVAGFKPEFNADRNLWFCDIELSPGDSYFPFVRLALARFQPHAVASHELSRVVRTEFLQLVPDRTAAISYASNRSVTVTVSGVSAHNKLAELEGISPVMSPPADRSVSLPAGSTPTENPDRAAGGGHRVTAQVQQRPSGGSNDLLWADSGNETELASYAETESVFWAASISLPVANPTQEFRLLIRELERYAADLVDAPTGVAAPVQYGTAYGERLVYAAAFPLMVSA